MAHAENRGGEPRIRVSGYGHGCTDLKALWQGLQGPDLRAWFRVSVSVRFQVCVQGTAECGPLRTETSEQSPGLG